MPATSTLTAQLAAYGLTCGPWVTPATDADGLDIRESVLEQRTIEGNQVVVQADPYLGLSYLVQDDYGHVCYWGTLYRPGQIDQLAEAIKVNLA